MLTQKLRRQRLRRVPHRKNCCPRLFTALVGCGGTAHLQSELVHLLGGGLLARLFAQLAGKDGLRRRQVLAQLTGSDRARIVSLTEALDHNITALRVVLDGGLALRLRRMARPMLLLVPSLLRYRSGRLHVTEIELW